MRLILTYQSMITFGQKTKFASLVAQQVALSSRICTGSIWELIWFWTNQKQRTASCWDKSFCPFHQKYSLASPSSIQKIGFGGHRMGYGAFQCGVSNFDFDTFGLAETNTNWWLQPNDLKLYGRTTRWRRNPHVSLSHNSTKKNSLKTPIGWHHCLQPPQNCSLGSR